MQFEINNLHLGYQLVQALPAKQNLNGYGYKCVL